MMNYVGSVSIIDRGDAPAKAIIDKNTRSLAQRVADETKQELDKVMDRVDNIYVSYEMSTQTMFDNPRGSPNVEYIEDIKELEEIITDAVKKKKYQQQVTVFIVGFQDICAQKMQLLQQVNQFFIENSTLDEEELVEEKPIVDLEEASTKVNESLNTAEELTKRLSDINQDIIDYLINYANTKASNKGKKKLEKSLESAKNDVNSLSEKLLTLQAELEEKEDKFQQVVKQLEIKSQEALRYKTAAEVAKQIETKNQEKLAKLQEEVDLKKMAIGDAEREMARMHREQLAGLEKAHQEEIEELKHSHAEEIAKLKGKTIGELTVEEEQLASKQESRSSTKDTKSSKKSEPRAVIKTTAKSPSRGKEKNKGKEFAEVSVQDEGGDPNKASVEKNEASRQPTRQSKNLEPVVETGDQEFTDVFDLTDEESWSSIPTGHVMGRFAQYRRLSLSKIKELEEQLNVTLTKTHRKVNSLKMQFSEHKNKWENERKILIEQVEQAQKLQTDAEKEADAAMTQLEEFINEQEKLEDEEETKRQEIIKTMSRPGTVKRGTSGTGDRKPERKTSVGEKPEEIPQQERLQTENSEQELKNLMQQTDDAKAQEKIARHQTGAISAPPAIEPEDGQMLKPDIGHEPIGGKTEEEIRISSARSRASLRNQFRSRLDETRHAVEERRTKSPVINVPTQKSVDDELMLDDDEVDDDDVDLPIPDDLKDEHFFREDSIDAGTSPPPVPRPSKRTSIVSKLNISEHPLVQQYLRAYTGVHNFKEALSRIMVDKDQMSASQILADLDMLPFDKESKVVPQIETMTENIYYVLNELSQVINSVLQNDRGPVVSSLMMGMSRDTTQRNFREKSAFTGDLQPPTRSSERSLSTKAESMISDSKYKELNEQYEKLQNQMSEDAKRYEEQQRHNMVVMMEMQDTINQLQRELSALGKQGRRPISESASTTAAGQSQLQQQQQDSAIMFTRLDSERNAKIMKKAVNEEKLDPNKYKEAVVQMDEYVSLPAQRLAHLVRKYVHHCRMKEIEENVQKSKSLNENVFEILDKMEALQNQRAKRWADRMDEMGMERLRLANMLMETLDGIEQDSGIFLIKPMYSYRGREPKDRFSTKTTRPLRPQRTLSPVRDSNSAYAPAPTPASNVRPYMRQSQPKGDTNVYSHGQDYTQPRYEAQVALEGNNAGLFGSSVNYVGIQPKETWSMSDSQPRMDINPNSGTISNTPRILELDINRMMIGQNTISANIVNHNQSNDRLVNATSNNLRSYMTVNRPAGPGSAGKADRSTSGSRGMERSLSTPTAHSPTSKHVRLADIEVPTVIPNTQPLPPIGRTSTTPDRPHSGDVRRRTPTRIPSGDEIPASPPGSSLRQSPPAENDMETS